MDMICPNADCGYEGPPEKRPYGSVFLALFLLIITVVGGIIYFLLFMGHKLHCPKCGELMAAAEA